MLLRGRKGTPFGREHFIFSTPFDEKNVDFLIKLGVNFFKTASVDLVNLPLIEKIGKTGKPFDMCYLPTQLQIAYDLAHNCDEVNLVLNHCGVPSIAAGEIDQWSKDMKKLSELPNVICKLSGLMAYCAPGTSSQETIQPYVDHVLECFGPNRIVWGSDWPVVNLGKGIQEWIKVTNSILAKLSSDEASKIGSFNAERIYKISI